MEDESLGEVEWYAPYERALFPISGVHVSHSLRRILNQAPFEIRYDSDFVAVMEHCRRPGENWIGPNIQRCYNQIHQAGWGHSVECWQDGQLVGGLYGVAIGGCFSAESMFHRVTDASKVALWAGVERARTCGFTLFDAQVMNPHLERMGAFELSHADYLKRLSLAKDIVTRPWPLGLGVPTGRPPLP